LYGGAAPGGLRCSLKKFWIYFQIGKFLPPTTE
jgi:hypothetical protein